MQKGNVIGAVVHVAAEAVEDGACPPVDERVDEPPAPPVVPPVEPLPVGVDAVVTVVHEYQLDVDLACSCDFDLEEGDRGTIMKRKSEGGKMATVILIVARYQKSIGETNRAQITGSTTGTRHIRWDRDRQCVCTHCRHS